jgi:hypothetical protein
MTYQRRYALLIAALALGGVGWQFVLNAAQTPEWGQRAWAMARYFTNITNVLLGLYMLRISMGGKANRNVTTSLTLSIIMVGIIYRLLLAPEVPKPSPDWYPDFFVHVAVPVLTALWWLIWGPKDIRLQGLPLWLTLPAVYCIYALTRGAISGAYPYFFFDIGRFGLGPVLLNCLGLVFVFALCGILLWAVARLIGKTILR